MNAHTILFIGGAWAGVLTLTLCMLTVAKRADEAMVREAVPDAEASLDGSLEAIAAELRWALGAERVTVVLADSQEPSIGRVSACLGAPGLVGRRVRMAGAAGTGVVRPVEALSLGLAGVDECPATWTFAHVPLAGDGRLVGAVTVASRSRAFTEDDLRVIERVARVRGRAFDRRRRRR